jgi:hypothetical protein
MRPNTATLQHREAKRLIDLLPRRHSGAGRAACNLKKRPLNSIM